MRRMLQSRKRGWTMVDYPSVVFKGKEREKKGPDRNRGRVCKCALKWMRTRYNRRGVVLLLWSKRGDKQGVLRKKRKKVENEPLPPFPCHEQQQRSRTHRYTCVCWRKSSWSQYGCRSIASDKRTRLDQSSVLSDDLRYRLDSDGRHNVDAKPAGVCAWVWFEWKYKWRKRWHKDIMLLLFSFFPPCHTIPQAVGIVLKENVATFASVHYSGTRVTTTALDPDNKKKNVFLLNNLTNEEWNYNTMQNKRERRWTTVILCFRGLGNLGRGLGVEGQCVKASLKVLAEGAVDEAVTLHSRLACECLRHDVHSNKK